MGRSTLKSVTVCHGLVSKIAENKKQAEHKFSSLLIEGHMQSDQLPNTRHYACLLNCSQNKHLLSCFYFVIAMRRLTNVVTLSLKSTFLPYALLTSVPVMGVL